MPARPAASPFPDGRPVRLGVVMDPIGGIAPRKDSTLAMLLAAQARGWELWYLELGDLELRPQGAWGWMRRLEVRDDPREWYAFGARREGPLGELDVVLMRKDPPYDLEYHYATQILERAEAADCLVINRPRALRDLNEKLAIARFPRWTPPFLVSRSMERLRAFLHEHGDVVLKPLEAMGGQGVLRLRPEDPNVSVVLELMTRGGRRQVMAQRFLPEIARGDRRILLVDGEPVPYALARIPAPGELRGNLAAGGRGEGSPLTLQERELCAEVGPWCREQGLLFVGLDVIGGRLTEINITSPTCIRELDALYGLDIAGRLMEAIGRRLALRSRARSAP